MIITNVRSPYRSRQANLTIVAGQPYKTEIICRRLPSKFRKMTLMHRITIASLTALIDQLSPRDKAILADLERTRVLTGAQLQRLHFTPLSTAARAP